ncbi:hypothetical protein RO3G_12203 [Rhizopus delemar RA 99-880]|uniref:Xylanolytic transcriptional activator regulatory domain-containing protein n=3 Tax=Rhizopus TaxID=4842 RepID=I1CGB2_RHIO9|nr:hypothetical protein RO3G_12203 [Rhizopus delemar RA 99-880]|eukprot:EIE87492.1 hypothetical protein RO3G_12203 [Rhizopus delemar RA 99-880]
MYKNDEQQQQPVNLDSTITTAIGGLNITSIGYASYVPELPFRLDRIEPCQSRDNNLNAEPPQPHLNIKPEVSMRFDLIQCYFDHVHPSIPFIDRSSMAAPQPPSLLLSAIYAVASRFHPQEQQQTGDPPGWSYYKMALSIIDIYLDTPRLSTVQALLLLVKYHEHIQRSGFFWRTKSLLQIAVQMASDLGLSRQSLNSYGYESEYRNRVFWAVYVYETLMSTEHGFQPYFLPNECTAQYPQYLEDEQSDDYNNVTNFHWLSKVVHVQGFVLQFMRSKHVTDTSQSFDEQTEFANLEKRLQDLGQGIPQIMSSNDDIHVYFIHLMYHVVNVLLYRPYAFSSYTNDSQYNFYCQSSASSITDIVEHVLSERGADSFYDTTRGHQQIIYCLTTAITVQRSAKNMVTYLQPFDLSQYEKTASILSVLVQKSPVTEIEDVSVVDSQSWSDTRKKQELASSSNTSSARSSPLDTSLTYPQSPTSPKIVKRISRSSLQIPSTPDSISYASPSTGSITPESIVYQRGRSASNRLVYAQNRLSAPSLSTLYQQHPNYYPPQLQQLAYPQQQMTSLSQPSSPTTQYLSNINGIPSAEQFHNTPSSPNRRPISQKLSKRRSTSFVGDFTIPAQRPTRTATGRPYPNARRHTVTNSVPPNLMNIMMDPASTAVGDLYSNPSTMARMNRYSAPPNTLLPYNIPLATQPVMMDSSFPMDPVIPDTPNESMMRILMNTDSNYNAFSSQQ